MFDKLCASVQTYGCFNIRHFYVWEGRCWVLWPVILVLVGAGAGGAPRLPRSVSAPGELAHTPLTLALQVW